MTESLYSRVPKVYTTRIVFSGRHVEIYEYGNPIRKGGKRKISSVDYEEDESSQPKEKSDFAIKRTRRQVRRLINANPLLDKFVTLTFAENITDQNTANNEFNKFIKRVIRKHEEFQYIAVPEFQKRGAIHYHLVCSLPYTPNSQLRDFWGHGFVNIKKIEGVENVGAYLMKYLSKGHQDQRSFGKKRFFGSRSLNKPIELLGIPTYLFIKAMPSKPQLKFETSFENEWVGKSVYRAFLLDKPFDQKQFQEALNGSDQFVGNADKVYRLDPIPKYYSDIKRDAFGN